LKHRVTFIPGDGIGDEISEATRHVLEATGVEFDWEVMEAGEATLATEGTPLPRKVIDSIRKNKVAIKGPITTPVGKGFRSVNVALRQELGLYACLRPCKAYPGAPSRYPGLDLVIVRENTEDLYAGIEFEAHSHEAEELISHIKRLSGCSINPDSGISIKPISYSASARIVQFAFEYARTYDRRKVTAVHKANIMKYSDGLFLEAARAVAKEYPDIQFEDRIVDNMCMQLVQKPELYDVIVLPNLYGDILSDLAAGLVGGLGVAPGANIGDGVALFEPTHGSAPKYKGLGKVNPMAMMLSGVMMLRHLEEREAADRLEKAISDTIGEGRAVTYDLKPPGVPNPATTFQVAQAVADKLNSR